MCISCHRYYDWCESQEPTEIWDAYDSWIAEQKPIATLSLVCRSCADEGVV
jgi:hypothetical protein